MERFLPQLEDSKHLDALERMIEEKRCEVLVVDPLYLCMSGADAANLFVQGSLLRRVSEICQRHGVALVLCHHTRKRGKARNQGEFDAPELDDLAWAGFAEFARQWLLLGRREPYEPGTGEHRLWLSVGGSAGHGGLWALIFRKASPANRDVGTLSFPRPAKLALKRKPSRSGNA